MRYRIGIVGGDVQPDGSSVHGDMGLSRLAEAGLHWEPVAEASPDEALAGFDAIAVLGGRQITAATLEAAPRVRHVARFGAGYDRIDVPACTAAGVLVTTTAEAVRRPMALVGLTLVLAVTHNLVQKHRVVERGDWSERGRWRGEHTDGSTVAIVGFGGIGAELAGMLRGLGYEVLGVNRRGSHPAAAALGVRMTGLDDALGAADIAVLCASLTPETRGMLGEREFALMRPGASFVNIGRGALVDQPALLRALQSGALRAAALDVFDPEPIPADDPLVALPNVTLTPHSLCGTRAFTESSADSLVRAFLAVAEGRSPETALNPEVLDHARWAR